MKIIFTTTIIFTSSGTALQFIVAFIFYVISAFTTNYNQHEKNMHCDEKKRFFTFKSRSKIKISVRWKKLI